MADSSGEKKGGPVQTIVIALIIALVAGGSAPWWIKKVFPDAEAVGTSPPPDGPKMGPLEGATNRNGGDLSTVGIIANSAPECSDLCRADSNCRAMTFVKHPNANGGICWLKGSVPSPISNPDMVSAVKL